MPLRAPKMYGFILGFQRLVWCPKWTPASSSCFMEISLIILFSLVLSSPFLFSVTHPIGHRVRDQKGCEISIQAGGFLRPIHNRQRQVRTFNKIRDLCVFNKDKRCTQGSAKTGESYWFMDSRNSF